MPVPRERMDLRRSKGEILNREHWKAVIPATDFPEEDCALLLQGNDVPFFVAVTMSRYRVRSMRTLAYIKQDEQTLITYLEKMLDPFFDLAGQEKEDEEMMRDATIATVIAAWTEARDRLKAENELNEKARKDPSAAPPIIDPALKESSKEEFIEKHPDMDLKEHDFLHDNLWDVFSAGRQRKAIPHLPVDSLRDNTEDVKVKKDKVDDGNGYEKVRKGVIQDKPVSGIPDARRRIRAYFFLMHMLAIAGWDEVGAPWMQLLTEFVQEMKPTIEAFVWLDEKTRGHAIKLYRTKRKIYPSLMAAMKHVMEKEFQHKMNRAVVLHKGGGEMESDFKSLTYELPSAGGDTRPAQLRAKRKPDGDPEDEQDPKRKKMASQMQSMMDRMKGMSQIIAKGGKGRGKDDQKGWKQNAGWRQYPGDDGKGKKGDRRKGGKEGKGGRPWKPRAPPPRDANGNSAPDASASAAPTKSRMVSDDEMAIIYKALDELRISSPDRAKTRYCFQFNSSLGCDKSNCLAHRCIKCGADHPLIGNH